MIHFTKGWELLELTVKENCRISDLAIRYEAGLREVAAEVVVGRMAGYWAVMKEAVALGLMGDMPSLSGLSGGDARKVKDYRERGRPLTGAVLIKGINYALAVAELNAAMGRIVAAPTAGSSGILPGVLLAVTEDRGLPGEEAVRGLFTAAAVGLIIAERATLAGSEGGCQAECGAAGAMAAAAAVELAGGTPAQCLNAAAMALKGVLGLVCDPVAGLVEIPCVKRNATGVANALAAADMALAGIESRIPFDEVVEAMAAVGRALPESLKETAQGGLAATSTARRIASQVMEGG